MESDTAVICDMFENSHGSIIVECPSNTAMQMYFKDYFVLAGSRTLVVLLRDNCCGIGYRGNTEKAVVGDLVQKCKK